MGAGWEWTGGGGGGMWAGRGGRVPPRQAQVPGTVRVTRIAECTALTPRPDRLAKHSGMTCDYTHEAQQTQARTVHTPSKCKAPDQRYQHIPATQSSKATQTVQAIRSNTAPRRVRAIQAPFGRHKASYGATPTPLNTATRIRNTGHSEMQATAQPGERGMTMGPSRILAVTALLGFASHRHSDGYELHAA